MRQSLAPIPSAHVLCPYGVLLFLISFPIATNLLRAQFRPIFSHCTLSTPTTPSPSGRSSRSGWATSGRSFERKSATPSASTSRTTFQRTLPVPCSLWAGFSGSSVEGGSSCMLIVNHVDSSSIPPTSGSYSLLQPEHGLRRRSYVHAV